MFLPSSNFLGGSVVKNPPVSVGDLWVMKIPWSRKQQLVPSILAWKIPWTEEPGRLQSRGSQKVKHGWATEHTHTQLVFSRGGSAVTYPCCQRLYGAIEDIAKCASRNNTVWDSQRVKCVYIITRQGEKINLVWRHQKRLCVVPEHSGFECPASRIQRALLIYFAYSNIYIFQCYSLKLPHPRLLPHGLKVCSLPLCLFCCLAYRVIVTIFLNPIYMHYTVLVFLFLTYFTMYNIIGSSFIHCIRPDWNVLFIMAE